MADPARQTIHLHNRVHRKFDSQPITYGVPWPEGAVRNVKELVALDESGERVPAAFSSLNTWADGSVQWSLVDTMVDFEPSADRGLTIAAGRGSAPKIAHPVVAEIKAGVATIGNGLVEIVLSGRAGQLLTRWHANGKPLIVDDGFDITFNDSEGRTFSLKAGRRKLTIECANPLRAVIRIDGKHRAADKTELLDYFLRFEVRANRADVKLTYSIRNRELPTPGIAVRAFEATFDTTAPASAKRCFTANTLTRHYEMGCPRVDEDPEIIASDTGDLDNYETAHKKGDRGDCFVRDPDVLHDPPEDKPWYLRDQKYRLQAGGSKCTWPYLALVGKSGGVIGTFERMTALHPKSLTASGSTLRFGIQPAWAGDLKITQGAGRSHVIYIAPVKAGASDEQIQTQYLSWELGGVHSHVPSMSSIAISPDLEHVRACKVFGIDKLPVYDADAHFLFERKVKDAWLGVTYGQLGAIDQIAPWQASGFWEYGDTGANNEEMNALVRLQQYLRMGDWACAEYGIAAATHIMEVDHVAFSIDHFQNGGMCAHCLNHNDGAAYPSHMWFTELLFAYVFTGDVEYKDAALRMCENLLHWIDDVEGFAIIDADQREAGQPMINLTWCYEFNRDKRYLDGCLKIIRDSLMAKTKRFGRMYDAKPHAMPVKVMSYGDYASYEGMYWYWEITRDEEVRQFMLSQLEWRLTPEQCGVHGFHRTTDYNPAAYAYHMTGDRAWVDRVARPLKAAFGAAGWPLGWIHAMYAIKVAFDLGVICDEDITVT